MNRKTTLLSFGLTILLAAAAHAAPRPYHLQLEARPAAVFPFLGKFGTVHLDLYPGGVRAETFWLNGFSKSGAPAITVMNPLGRMYTDVPLRDVRSILQKLSGTSSYIQGAVGTLAAPTAGSVRGIPASRYRIVYGPDAYIDVWTTSAIPPNAQFRAIVGQFIAGISPSTTREWNQIPNTPVYVELNFRRFRKVPLLTLKSLQMTNEGEGDALSTGALYFRAPFLDSLWK